MIIIDDISQNSVGSTSCIFQHRVNSQDAILVIFVNTESGAPTTVKFNGSNLTQLVNISEPTSTFTGNASAWIMINPPVGTYTVDVRRSTATFCSALAVTLLGVNKKTSNFPTGSVTGTGAANGTLFVPITPTSANSLIIDFLGDDSNAGNTGIFTYDASQTQISSGDTNAAGFITASFKYANPGSQTMSFTRSGTTNAAQGFAYIAVAFEPADPPSLWQPNIRLRSQNDIVGANGLDSRDLTPLKFTVGYKPSTFWQNSFLHTVGRVLDINSAAAPPSQINQLAQNILSFWQFNEGIGTDVRDVTNNGNNGIFVGNPATNWIKGQAKDGGLFDNGNYVSVGNPAILNPTNNALTISAWIFPTEPLYNNGEIVKKDGQYIFRIDQTNISFLTWANTAASEFKLGATFQNTWNHVVAVYDGSASPTTTIYLNGKVLGTATAQAGNLVTGSNPLTIGAQNGSGENFQGVIKQVGIWNRGLTSNEVSQLYNNGQGLPYPFYQPPATFGAFDYKPFTNWQNSFLQTIGRNIDPTQPVIAQVSDKGFFSMTSQIIIDKIVQGQTVGNGLAAGVLNLSVSIPSPDAVLVVTGGSVVATGAAWASVALNGVPLTKLVQAIVVGADAEIWWLPNPPVGTYTLTITGGNTTAEIYANAITILGVDKRDANLITASAVDAASTATITGTILPDAANSLVLDVFSSLDATQAPTMDGSQTQLGNAAPINANEYVYSSYKIGSTASVSMSYNLGATVNAAWAAIALRPATYASMWFPNIDIRSLNDIVRTAGLDAGVNPASGQYGYKGSQLFLNSFLHTVGRMNFPSNTQVAQSVPYRMLMGMGQ